MLLIHDLNRAIFGHNPHESVQPQLTFIRRCRKQSVLTLAGQYNEVEGESLLDETFLGFEDVVENLNADNVLVFVLLLVTQLVVEGVRINVEEFVLVVQHEVPPQLVLKEYRFVFLIFEQVALDHIFLVNKCIRFVDLAHRELSNVIVFITVLPNGLLDWHFEVT